MFAQPLQYARRNRRLKVHRATSAAVPEKKGMPKDDEGIIGDNFSDDSLPFLVNVGVCGSTGIQSRIISWFDTPCQNATGSRS
jgi:hypothetical protein